MAPQDAEEVRLERLTSAVGNMLQFSCALLFSSYFFWGPCMGLGLLGMSPWGLGICQWRGCGTLVAAYFAQLLLYRPHMSRGWPSWMLYSPIPDYVLHYYDATCIREGPKLDPAGHYMFVTYPHGVYGVCRAFSGGVRLWGKLFPGITARWGSFGNAFFIPGVREFSLLCGCLDASKPVLSRAIERGENIHLLPGGIDEMMLTDGKSTDTKIVMADRKGYAKLAIQHGLDIVPGFCFGEKWVHETLQMPPMFRGCLRRLRLSGTLLKGRGPSFLGFLGFPLGFVWGEPIRVQQQNPVDPAYLDEVHGAVEASVKDIFARYKERFGYGPEETLTVVAAKGAAARHAGADPSAGGRSPERR